MATEAGTTEHRPHPHPGFFLVLDGPDGGGKTAQAARLVDWLRTVGLDVVSCRDPGGTALGNRIRSLVMDRDAIAIALGAEMLLFMASRAQMIEEVIRPALEAGRVVVCDRFTLATIVYQGYAGGLDPAAIARVGAVATGGLLPDLTIVLDVPPAVARARVGPARDRIEDRPESYHDRVRRGYLEAAQGGPGRADAPATAIYPAPVVVIDASADAPTVFQRIQREVGRVLALDPRS
jgi:dTMP kinase